MDVAEFDPYKREVILKMLNRIEDKIESFVNQDWNFGNSDLPVIQSFWNMFGTTENSNF